jgi:membrane-associated protein
VIFCETGLVVMPFLPGDSLLFIAGAVAAGGGMDPVLLGGLLMLAAIMGDSTNYVIGRTAGEKLVQQSEFENLPSRLLCSKPTTSMTSTAAKP